MNKPVHSFTFKPVVDSQRDLIHCWLQQDYIREWIHGTGLQNTLRGLEKFLQLRAKGLGLDRQCEYTQHWIGYDGDKPFVYLLTSNLFRHVDNDYTQYSTSAGLMLTLDIFICDKDYLGKGYATEIIHSFLLSHFKDVSEIFIDPEKANKRAIHVYLKAGFRIMGEFIAPWHPVPHVIMKLNVKDITPLNVGSSSGVVLK